MSDVTEMKGQVCPTCNKKTLTLAETERDIPYFGQVFLFSMSCEKCGYYKADLEATEQHDPAKYSMEIDSEEDMSVRVVRSGQATIKIPRITTITPGPGSSGYVTNIEGILKRIKHQLETILDGEEEKADKKKVKNMLKKIQKVMWGQEKIKISVEDPTGNSAIISDKAVKSKIKGNS
jgi:zinc finger protein